MRRAAVSVCVLGILLWPAFASAQKGGGKAKGGAAKKGEGKGGAKGKKKQPREAAGRRRPPASASAGFSDEGVERAIQKGVKALFAQQKPSGSWGP